MKVYRVEHKETLRGLCYNEHGEFSPIYLENGQLAVDLPMPFNHEYTESGLNWYAAGETLEDMLVWFNESNVEGLLEKGFVLREFEVDEAFGCEGHLKFDRDRVKNVIELDIRILGVKPLS